MSVLSSSKKKEVLSVVILLGLVFLGLVYTFDFFHYKISTPIVYAGGDDFSLYKNAKMMMDGSLWNLETERLGAPYGAKYYDFLPDCLQNTDLLIIKFFSLFSMDPVTVVNLAVLSLFFLTALTTFYSLREMGVNRKYAIMGALVFDFMYYHLVRMIGHYCLAAYEMIPISVLLCVWLWQDERFFCWGKGFFKYYKNILAIVFMLLLANNGIAYYPFFTCMFLGFTGVSKSIKRKKWKPMLKMLGLNLSIIIFMFLAMLPAIIYQTQNGSMLVYRNIYDSEQYGLKIIQMLVPYKAYGKIASFWNDYYGAFLFTEAHTSYIGFFAGVGFILLLLGVMWKRQKTVGRRGVFSLFIELNLIAVLFGTMGGFGSIFFDFVVNMLRATNRISIFIAFFAVAAVCLVLTEVTEREYKKFRWMKPAVVIAAILFTGVSLKDQIPVGITNIAAQNEQLVNSDRKFIQEIESQLPENAMVYQLPYHAYPEGGPVINMADYQLLTGYIFSDTLRWSYGGSKGREGDSWNKQMSEKTVAELVPALKEQKFAGIYLDKRAYDEPQFTNLLGELSGVIGHEPIMSDNGNLYFYKF